MKTLIIAAVLMTFNLKSVFSAEKDQVIELKVTEKGFEPSTVDVKPNVPVTLKITRQTDTTCATQIKIQSKNIKKDLPLNKPVTIQIGKLEKGEIRFGCGMDMITGLIHVR